MLTRVFPFGLEQIQRDLDRVFGELGFEAETRRRPAANVYEDGDVFVAAIEVPGVKLDDIEVSVHGQELTIKGERKANPVDGTEVRRHERCSGAFSRRFELPTAIDAEQVEAKLENGILTVRLPKAASAKARKITVTAG